VAVTTRAATGVDPKPQAAEWSWGRCFNGSVRGDTQQVDGDQGNQDAWLTGLPGIAIRTCRRLRALSHGDF